MFLKLLLFFYCGNDYTAICSVIPCVTLQNISKDSVMLYFCGMAYFYFYKLLISWNISLCECTLCNLIKLFIIDVFINVFYCDNADAAICSVIPHTVLTTYIITKELIKINKNLNLGLIMTWFYHILATSNDYVFNNCILLKSWILVNILFASIGNHKTASSILTYT